MCCVPSNPMRLLKEVQRHNFQVPPGERRATVQILSLNVKSRKESHSLCSNEDISKYLENSNAKASLLAHRKVQLEILLNVSKKRTVEFMQLEEREERHKESLSYDEKQMLRILHENEEYEVLRAKKMKVHDKLVKAGALSGPYWYCEESEEPTNKNPPLELTDYDLQSAETLLKLGMVRFHDMPSHVWELLKKRMCCTWYL